MSLCITAKVSEADRHLKDITSLIFHNGKLYSGAEDGKVKVWSSDLCKSAEFQAHQTVVFDLAVIGDRLYTASNDSSAVQAWDADSYQKKNTLLGEGHEVWRLHVHDGRLFAGDVEGKVWVWSGDELLKVYELSEEVRGLAAHGSLLYTIRDRDLVITEVLPGEKSRTVTRQTVEGSSPMCLVGTRVCFASRTGIDILVHDNNKQSCFKQLGILKAHDMIMNVLCAEGDSTVYSGGYDGKVKKWDVSTLQNLAECNIGSCINTMCIGLAGIVYVGGSNGLLVRVSQQ